MPYVIGLTGNIATGKSTVARMLGRLGADRLDADKLAHSLMLPGSDVHRAVVARFGPAITTSSGEIDRSALGQIVFADPRALADLEALVHPAVIAAARDWLAGVVAPVAVIEAIKLLEAGMRADCDAVWVVTSPRTLQEQRLYETRGLTPEQARARIDAQPPQEDKVRAADVVIDNGGALDDTWRQVLRGWNTIPAAPAIPDDIPWLPDANTAKPQRSGILLIGLALGLGLALLVLLGSAHAGLSTPQRVWFTAMGLALGLVCTWMITWE